MAKKKRKQHRKKGAVAHVHVGTPAAAKKAEALEGVFHIKVNDLELELHAETLNDFELIEQMGMGNPVPVFHAICGDREEEIRNALRDENGKLSVTAVYEFVQNVFEVVQQGNSPASP